MAYIVTVEVPFLPAYRRRQVPEKNGTFNKTTMRNPELKEINNVGCKKFKVEARKEGNDFNLSIDGKSIFANVTEIGNSSPYGIANHLSVVLENKSYDAIIEGNTVYINGQPFIVKVEDERFVEIRIKDKSKEASKTTVISHMPGLIIEVIVKVGDIVKANDGLLILEAMKMQNEIKSSGDGTVKQIFVQKGMSVNKGDALVVIE